MANDRLRSRDRERKRKKEKMENVTGVRMWVKVTTRACKTCA